MSLMKALRPAGFCKASRKVAALGRCCLSPRVGVAVALGFAVVDCLDCCPGVAVFLSGVGELGCGANRD